MNPAAQAVCPEDKDGDGRWMSQHKRYISEAKEKEPDVLFIGDSIVQRLTQTEFWPEMFEPLHSLNFGIGGDTTCNVLWRIQNQELDYMTPKVIVLMVGTNNTQFEAEDTVGGLLRIIECLQEKQPAAYIIITSILPRGEKPNKLRIKSKEINKRLSEELDGLEQVTFLVYDDSLFVNPHDGTISHLDMMDYLHLTRRGYRKLCEPLFDEIQSTLQTFVNVPNTEVETASLAGELAGDK